MTRAAREERAAAAARRGEVAWAVQALINLRLLADAMPQEHPSLAVLDKFVRQAPPSIQQAAASAMADAVTQRRPARMVAEASQRPRGA
jgi:hypothetical protein